MSDTTERRPGLKPPFGKSFNRAPSPCPVRADGAPAQGLPQQLRWEWDSCADARRGDGSAFGGAVVQPPLHPGGPGCLAQRLAVDRLGRQVALAEALLNALPGAQQGA